MTSTCCLLSESYGHCKDISVREIIRHFESEKHGESPGTVGMSHMSGDICVFFPLHPGLFLGGNRDYRMDVDVVALVSFLYRKCVQVSV
jgi:hypothetical protein